MTRSAYRSKWDQRFATNDSFLISATDLREFKDDTLTVQVANSAQSLSKACRLLTRAQVVANGGDGQALEDIDLLSCCLGTQATVEIYRVAGQPDEHNVIMAMRYDDTPGAPRTVYVDGSFTPGQQVPGKWVRLGSTEDAATSVRRWSQDYDKWKIDETMKIDFAGKDYFYTSRKAGGPLAAPTVAGQGTDNWKVASTPAVGTALSQLLTLAEAQGLEGDSVVAGRTYLVDFGPDAQGYSQTISLLGVSNNSFNVTGTLEVNGTRTPVTAVNVFAGTWEEINTSSYDDTAIRAQLATKLSAPVKYSSFYGLDSGASKGKLALDRTYLETYVQTTVYGSTGDTRLALPSVTLDDVGKAIYLYGSYVSGIGYPLTLTQENRGSQIAFATLNYQEKLTFVVVSQLQTQPEPAHNVAQWVLINSERFTPEQRAGISAAKNLSLANPAATLADIQARLVADVYPYSWVKLAQETRPKPGVTIQQIEDFASVRLVGGGTFTLSLAVSSNPDTVYYGLRVPKGDSQATVKFSSGVTLDGEDSVVLQPGEWRIVGLDPGAAGTYVTMLSGGVGGGTGASNFSQLAGAPRDNAALAAELDKSVQLDPATGQIKAAQIPQITRLVLTFAPGQTTNPEIFFNFPDLPGQYGIESVVNVSSYSFYKNGAPVQLGNTLFVSGDTLSGTGTVGGGTSSGYITLRKA